MKFTTDQDHLTFFFLYDNMTTKQKKICVTLMDFHKKLLMGEHTETRPSIPYIAHKSGCCPRTVNTFIKEFEGKIHFHKNRYNKEIKKCESNLYCLNNKFFEFLILLEMGGYLYKWKKVKKDLLIGLSEEEHFICSKLYEKGHLSTTKLRAGFASKLRGIESFFSYQILMKKVPRTRTDITVAKEREAFQELNDLPLSFAEKERLSLQWSINSLREARKDYFYYSEKKHVDVPVAFMMAQAKMHTIKTLRKTWI